jgi:putative tryptophan/tyrosine transport system substrate-binding protein
MRRREFITLLGGLAVTCPLAARAQQLASRPLIGVLVPISQGAAARNVAEFRAALSDLGYIEGRTVALEIRYGDGVPERLPQLAAELVALKPSMILAGSQSGAVAVHEATRTIPLVVITADDPVGTGLVDSISRPGGNITGTWTAGDDALVGKRLEFLADAVPGLARLGILLNPDDPADAINYKRVPPAARALGLTFQIVEVRGADFEAAFAQAARAGMQALFISEGPTFNSRATEIAAIAVRTGLPAVYGFRAFVAAGGLMSYGVNLPSIFRRSAQLADKILKGTSPADLPIEIPVRWELVINLKAAAALGIAMPTSLLIRADEVIE